MKRSRAVDGRQFRRAGKKANKFTESVYFNPSTFTYVKLVFIWLVCITLDLLVGVRIELGWPIWLFFRHYSEIVSAPNGPLRFYSTFSIFYLFLTLTSDLICYLFLPVQLLLFFASTYVWLQVAYQWMATERGGLCPRVVFFWIIFASFEYFFRFRILMPHWYNSRSVWVTASLFPAVTDTFVANQASAHRLVVYRVLASHALGFPLVTLGFRLKQTASNWAYERRRSEVQNVNEGFDRILTEALPAVYEGKKRHEVNSRQHHLAIEGDVLDFELDVTGADLDEPRLYASSNGPLPSFFDKGLNNAISASPAPSQRSNGTEAPATSSGGNPYNRKTSRHSKAPMKQNGSSHNGVPHKSGKKNGGPNANGNRNGSAIANANSASANNLEEDVGDDDHLPMRTPTVISLGVWLLTTAYNALASLTSASSASLRASGSDANVDDRPSSVSSGVGGEDFDSDGCESVATSNLDAPTNGGYPAASKSGTNGTANTVQTNTSQVTATTATASGTTSQATGPTQSGGGKKKGKQKQNQGGRGRANTSDFNYGEAEYEVQQSNGFMRARRGGSRMESPEDELNRLRNEAKGAKLIESELRERISSMQQFERTAKNETQQYKLRCDQLDAKYRAQVKQNEQARLTIVSLEKRLNDAQVRKDAMERELMLERGTKNSGDSSTDDLLDSMRQKIVKLESDLRKTRAETRAKEEMTSRLEAKLEELQAQRSSAQKIADDGSRKISDVQHDNNQLRKALSEENRVKQDLFKALKTSKAQIDTLQARLRSLGCNGGLDEPTDGNVTGLADLRSSPTTIPSTPAASRAPESFDQLFSMTGTSYLSYPYGSNTASMSNLRLSPSELRDSPPNVVPAEPTPSNISPTSRPVATPQSLTP
uniref:Macoilin n=1 Tax=Panagrellus redivivus TaxID=6233 RepID=A0A7E4ZVW2_PANRE